MQKESGTDKYDGLCIEWSKNLLSDFDDSWVLIANEAAANLNSFRKQASNSTHDSKIYRRII